uniref:Helicase ATP-binding domain-containing protein n=1 Tax=viral metagenome TaxID=1070528 RepID=A0A6C0JB02_9ZZZZ
MTSQPTTFNPLKTLISEPNLPGWKVTLNQRKARVYPRGTIMTGGAMRFQEQKKKHKKGEKPRTNIIPVYDNGLLVPWQIEFATALNQGDNTVVASVTSTGKTWAGVLTVAYETLSRDDARCLILCPNSEVMRDTVKDLETWFTKRYLYGKTMISTMTRNFINYDLTRKGPPGQIMVLSIESAVTFLTDPDNRGFIEALKFIVFDEVHMPSVTEALWWSQYIPHTAQLVLLSATIGDPVHVKNIVNTMQGHNSKRPQRTQIFTRDVRPIPLQLLTFKGGHCPRMGIRSTELRSCKELSCIINPNDPTIRDLKSLLGTKADIPRDRDSQFKMGMEIIPEHMDIIKTKNSLAIEEAVTDTSSENIYNLMCYLSAKDMLPVLIFNSTSEQAKAMTESLVAHIEELERNDPEYRSARTIYDRYVTSKRRARDEDIGKCEGGKKTTKEQNDWSAPLPEDSVPKGINMTEIENTLQKWRIRCDFKLQREGTTRYGAPAKGASSIREKERKKRNNIEQWILDALDCGIGVYIGTSSTRVRHKIYDAVREGKIKVLISDESISCGVNLPFRTVILCGVMAHSLYKQAGGRAGRQGMDDRGYIVHLMPKEQINQFIYQKRTDVELYIPKNMSFTALLRLQIPNNLSNAVEPNMSEVAHIKKPKEREIMYERLYISTFVPGTPSTAINDYHTIILENYMNTLNVAHHHACVKQLQVIRLEQWHYHRLTNLFKVITEDNSILFIKLMLCGKFSVMTTREMINFMAILLFRVEATDDIDAETLANDYYVPDFSKSQIPELSRAISVWKDKYGIDIDFTKPIHKYLLAFCYDGKRYLKYMSELNSFKEWIYALKSNIMRCAPSTHSEFKDKTSALLYSVDAIYLSSCARKHMEIIM